MSDLPEIPRVLCQPSGNRSCGACCGMYNHREASFDATWQRLSDRTAAYRREADIDDAASLRRFRQRWEPRPEDKLLDGLPSCPFLGILDDPIPEGRLGRVGCLVHPKQNDGVDGRDCGVYDRHICEDYLCAAHDLLTANERALVLRAVDDSYLYGLVITNVRLVRELLEQAARIVGAYPDARALGRPGVVEAAAAFFALMADWPYRAADGIFGQIVAGRGLETSRRQGAAASLGVEPDRWEAILACLGTEVRTLEELECARALVRERVEAFAAVLV